MTTTIDRIADELTAALTARIDACGNDANGVNVLIGGEQVSVTSVRFRELIEQEHWRMSQRGIRPAVRQQVIRNVEAWVRFGPPAGGEATTS
jgi:hypothetical protein